MSWLKKAVETHPNLTFTPEYAELSKLIKILMQTGQIRPEAIEQEMQGREVRTIDDVVDLQERLYRMAIEVYKIPMEYLASKLWGKKILKSL